MKKVHCVEWMNWESSLCWMNEWTIELDWDEESRQCWMNEWIEKVDCVKWMIIVGMMRRCQDKVRWGKLSDVEWMKVCRDRMKTTDILWNDYIVLIGL